MRFKLLPTTRSSLVQLCHLVRGLPLGLIMAARALPETSSSSLVGAIESALTTPAFGDRRAESWWTSPQWASVLDTADDGSAAHGSTAGGATGVCARPISSRQH
jgi:hypothetical protein